MAETISSSLTGERNVNSVHTPSFDRMARMGGCSHVGSGPGRPHHGHRVSQVDDCAVVPSAQCGEEAVAFAGRNVSFDHDWNVTRHVAPEEVTRHFPGVRARTGDGAPPTYDVFPKVIEGPIDEKQPSSPLLRRNEVKHADHPLWHPHGTSCRI